MRPSTLASENEARYSPLGTKGACGGKVVLKVLVSLLVVIGIIIGVLFAVDANQVSYVEMKHTIASEDVHIAYFGAFTTNVDSFDNFMDENLLKTEESANVTMPFGKVVRFHTTKAIGIHEAWYAVQFSGAPTNSVCPAKLQELAVGVRFLSGFGRVLDEAVIPATAFGAMVYHKHERFSSDVIPHLQDRENIPNVGSSPCVT